MTGDPEQRESDEVDLLERFEQLGARVRIHFNRACATVRVIEMGYGIYGHDPGPEAIIDYIRRRVYAGVDDDVALRMHVDECRECRRLLRRHAIRKAIYERLGLDVPHWSH